MEVALPCLSASLFISLLFTPGVPHVSRQLTASTDRKKKDSSQNALSPGDTFGQLLIRSAIFGFPRCNLSPCHRSCHFHSLGFAPNLRCVQHKFASGPVCANKRNAETLLNPRQTESVFILETQMFLYTVFFFRYSPPFYVGRKTIFKAISALASSGPVFTSASHTHLFAAQT